MDEGHHLSQFSQWASSMFVYICIRDSQHILAHIPTLSKIESQKKVVNVSYSVMSEIQLLISLLEA